MSEGIRPASAGGGPSAFEAAGPTDLRLHRGRWATVIAAMVAVAATTPLPWTIAIGLPIIASGVAVHRFTRRALDDWCRTGLLFTADALLVVLALLGSSDAPPLVFLAFFGALGIAIVAGNRAKAAVAGGAWFLAAVVLGGEGLLGLWLDPGHAAYLPVAIAALFHFGYLGERLGRPRAEPTPVGLDENRELHVLLEISDAVTSTLHVNQVMRSIVEHVGELVGAPSCSIIVAERGTPGCFVMASKGHPEAEMLRIDLEKYPEVQQALETREPVVIEDVGSHPLLGAVRDKLLARGHRSALVVPLLFGEEVLGTLFLKSPREGAFPPGVQRFCRVAAGVSANALQNAMLFREVSAESARHRETGLKLRSVLDGTPDMIVATDGVGIVTEWSRGAERITGWSAAEAAGRDLGEILGAEALRSRAEREPRDVLLRRRDSSTRELSLLAAELGESGGARPGHVWIGRDVTRLRTAERSLIQAERLSSLGGVVAGVAHELNNPLSGVVGYAELLRSHAADADQIRDLDRIVESAMRCQKIVLNLLSFSRKHPPEKRYRSLNDCVHKVLELKSYQLRSSQIETKLALDAALPHTSYDFHQIEQVVLNLLNNAEQALRETDRVGEIVIRTGGDGSAVWIEVDDDGPGIPPHVRGKIFDPFFTTKGIGEGTGLGLSVSYGIVQEHGGSIDVEDNPRGRGVRFRVRLPIVEGEPPVEASASDRPPASALSGKNILVAEDDPTVLELFARLLSAEGARVTLVQDGEEAWDRLDRGDFDLIVADLRMPNLSGQQLYERVGAERPELLRRFVFATGDLVRDETRDFLARLPNRTLLKPLELETVRRVLTQAIAAAA